MKALTYLQYSLLVPSREAVEYLRALRDAFEGFGEFNVDDIFSIFSIAHFKNQPMHPELIPKYFKGWKLNGDSYENEIYKDCYNSIDVKFGWITYWRGDNNKKFYIPDTLDDFIRDCQRAGIDLELNIPEEL